jgi:tRNA A37 methylthiotransferase MiaB
MLPAGPILQCICGKSFLLSAALNHHTRTCARSKKQITNALSKAKQAFEERRARKRQRREESVQVVVRNEVDPVVPVSHGCFGRCTG